MQHSVLALAGLIGAATAIFHGILTERLMVRPIGRALADQAGVSATIRRIVPPLLQYSTFSWLVSGIALIFAALFLGDEARLAVGLQVGAQFIYAALANAWATLGKHPGWMLMAAAVALIAVDSLGWSPVA